MNKKILSVIVVMVLLTGNVSFAIVDKNSKDDTKVKISATKKQEKPSKKKNSDLDEVKVSPYTNDVHSVFSLEDCIKIAIEYNPYIRASVYDAMAAKTKIGQAWANYFPRISVGLEFSRSGTNYRKTAFSSMPDNTLGYLPTLSGDWMLFDFGKTKAQADSYKRTYESKELTTKEDINQLICKIKTAYYNVLFAQAQVKVYEDTVADYQLQLKQAWSFYKIGIKAKIDVITAEYNLGKAQLNYVKAKNVLAVANVQLAQIMGIPEYTNFELSSQLGTLKFDITQDVAIETAYSVRPELIATQKTVEAARMNLRAKRRDFAPDLSLYGAYGNGIGSEYGIESYTLGAALRYTSLNIMQVKKQIDEAKFQYKRSQAILENQRHLLYLNVKKMYLELKTAEEAVQIAKLALDEAKEQYRQVSGRYKAGVGDAIELKDGETTYLNARLDFYNALLNYNTTAANLEKEIGVPLKNTTESILKTPVK